MCAAANGAAMWPLKKSETPTLRPYLIRHQRRASPLSHDPVKLFGLGQNLQQRQKMAFFQHRQRTAHFGSRDIILSPRSRGIRGILRRPRLPSARARFASCVHGRAVTFLFDSHDRFFFYLLKGEVAEKVAPPRPPCLICVLIDNYLVCTTDGGPAGLRSWGPELSP